MAQVNFAGRAKIRTTGIPWLPRSSPLLNVIRRTTNRYFPSVRATSTATWLDGPLHTRIPESRTLHSQTLTDDYKYMENPNNRDAIKAWRLENGHYERMQTKMDLKHGKHRMWGELDARVLISTREAGFDKGEERIGDHVYYCRSLLEDSSQIAYYRKKMGETDMLAEELINPVTLQKQFGYPHCSIGVCRVSENGKMLAYTLSVEGGDRFICHVRTTDNASIFHIIRSSNIVSIDFGSSNNFFYTECNELNRPYRVMMQELRPGLLPDPVEVYRDDDEDFFVDVRRTKDGKYMVLSSDSKTKGNVCVLPSSYPVIPKTLKPFFPDGRPVEIAGKESWGWVEHHGKHFIMITSKDAPNFKAVVVREEVALRDKLSTVWNDFVPENPKTLITDVDIFKTHFVLFEGVYGFERTSQIRILDISDGLDKVPDRSKDQVLHFPPLSTVVPGLNRNFVQDAINFTYSNVVTPARECTFQLNSNLKPEEIRWGNPNHIYTTRQHEVFTPWDYMWPYHMYRDVATAPDGTDIPITICQKRDLFVDEITDADPLANTPRYCFLYVYGAYGETIPLQFQPAPYLWLMRRRWTVAFAHVRGGGDRPGWAEEGRHLKKMNTVTDFMACCEHLINNGYTERTKLVVAGNSAGCVPIASAMNMRGNSLFTMALMRAPFLDIINTMCDPDLPLSLSERGDWGDPLNNETDLKYLQQYDPYYNINDNVHYPSMIVSTCLDDDRVPAWNALKYVAKIREQRSRDRGVDPVSQPIMLRMKPTGGHYHWTDQLPLSEELITFCQMFDMGGPGAKPDDLDTMQQMHNFFESGLCDHDDTQQTFLKWDAWEYERLDFMAKMNRMSFEPNFRVLSAKKDPYYWDRIEQERVGAPPPPGKPNYGEGFGPDPFQQNSRKTNFTSADRKTK